LYSTFSQKISETNEVRPVKPGVVRLVNGCRELAERRQLHSTVAGDVERERRSHRRVWQTPAVVHRPLLCHRSRTPALQS